MPESNRSRSSSRRIAAAVLLLIPAVITLYSVAQHIETSKFNEAPMRPVDPPQVVAAGKALYEKNCQSCHSADLRGKENIGPNILRSQDALVDMHGESLEPIIRGEKAGLTNHRILTEKDDVAAVAAYVRSILTEIGSQGRPPGDSLRSPNILVGDAASGKQYFEAKCTRCHSAEGDMKGIGKKISSPKTLQSAWIRGNHFGVPVPVITATVQEPGKPAVEGTAIHVDDFLVTVKLQDGTMQTIRRTPQTKVEVHDPLEAHRNLLPTYTDKDIHDVTAYLVTLK
ncbi:c-type cytochrome [Terriglobus albidus]|uniref:c-type cytochrome n=1 Tax=Terriglobus albidus TaxID=1592106 RepID=UPI0021E0772C|nr:c-type cytochrome [Terriglobus albidus]